MMVDASRRLVDYLFGSFLPFSTVPVVKERGKRVDTSGYEITSTTAKHKHKHNVYVLPSSDVPFGLEIAEENQLHAQTVLCTWRQLQHTHNLRLHAYALCFPGQVMCVGGLFMRASGSIPRNMHCVDKLMR